MDILTPSGAAIPAIGLGTWDLRGAACRDAVIAALAAGYRHIDTAAMYGNEEAVGEGLRRSGVPRDRVFLVTKVWPDTIGDGPLQRSAAASARRLGVDAVDLLLIHWPSRSIPLAESIAALNDARRRGLAAHIGVSNFDAPMLTQAVRLSEAPLVADQLPYHPGLDQSDLLTTCKTLGVAFVSYSPLAKRAVLTDRRIVGIAARHGRTAAQIVLRWHVQQGCVAIPKSGDPQRIRENIAVVDFALSPEEMAAILALR
ncbi:MAG: aldo/keto reductase [Bauldia sp.]